MFALIVGCGNERGNAADQDSAAGAAAAAEKKREKKDRGDFSMLLDGVEWAASSASARLRDGKLNISGSRIDGSPSTSMVRQAVSLDIADFDGPGTYTLGMMSTFSVVGFDTGTAQESDLDQPLAEALSKAAMVRLQNSEVVIDSVSKEAITGRFSPGAMRSASGEPIAITEGRFRVVVRE